MISLHQYKKICEATDKILDAVPDSDEIVSIPMLHVIREHPEYLKPYNFLFGKGKPKPYKTENLYKKLSVLIRSVFFDYKIRQLPDSLFKKSRKLIIVSHITNPNQCNNITDEYFGNLHTDLLGFSDIKPVILLINHTSLSSFTLSKKLQVSKVDRIVIPKSSGLVNEFKAFFRLVSSIHYLTKRVKINNLLSSMIIKAMSSPRVFLSGMSALRIGFFIEKIVRISNAEYLITTYEGHSRERIIFSSARKANKNISCYAYQHSIFSKYQHALTRNIQKKYNPDHIFCCGNITRDVLNGYSSLNGVGISVLGSPKGLPIIPKRSRIKNKNPTFLFLPQGIESEYRIFFNFLLECSNAFPGFRFRWRSHPLLDLMELDFFKKKSLPSNITISSYSFDDDLIASDVAIYRGTTAIIRASMGGLVPIYLKNEEEIEIDIMFGLKIDRISSISDIRFVIDNSFIDRGDIVKFCQNYFQPMNYKSIMDVIDKNGF